MAKISPECEIQDGGFYAKVILDSLAPCDKRLTTLEIRYPRFIHSEVLTHRDRARNSASSRAIPWPVMCERISDDPVVPIAWGMENRGMQTGEQIPAELVPLARAIWLKALHDVMPHAKNLHNIDDVIASTDAMRQYRGMMSREEFDTLETYAHNRWRSDTFPTERSKIRVHKSICNRLTEPFMWITVVMTATEWANFFRLRCHPDAEIHFQKIAGMIRAALSDSTPRQLDAGMWHLPYVDSEEFVHAIETPYPGIENWKKISAARCARVSYLTQDGDRDIKKDLDLFDRLANGSGFGHWSPMEHVAQALEKLERSGPYIGWKQFRKEFPNECA